MAIMVVLLALNLAGIAARGDAAGADARAYWAAVRIWLDGGDPYHPTGPFLPYVYAPWMLPLFIPWAMLPWDVAWYAWRGGTILLLLWSVRWAYARRPLATALLLVALAIPIGANFDTGNIDLLLAVALFGAQFAGSRLGGLLWALATWMKWVPAPIWLVLPPRSRAWGLVFLALSGLLSLIMLPLTIVQLQALFGFGHRPIRADYLVFIWALVPWWWRLDHPFAFLRPAAWATATTRIAVPARTWGRAFREAPVATARRAGERLRPVMTRYLGLEPGRGTTATQGQAWAAGSAKRGVAEIGD
jgi:Glycosyltransferase family 87